MFRLTLFISVFITLSLKSQDIFVKTPTQTIDYTGILGFDRHDSLTVDSFEISPFVTYGQYKKYLKSVQQDSSLDFYYQQFPDSNMCLPECYQEYTSSNKYDNDPVLGVSWEAAINYCRWRTRLENQSDTLKFEYCLPNIAQWTSTYAYNDKRLLINQLYSDWLLLNYVEAYYGSTYLPFQWPSYIHSITDPPALKRKFTMGDNILYSFKEIKDHYHAYHYSFEGYRYVSFRVVKTSHQHYNRYLKL